MSVAAPPLLLRVSEIFDTLSGEAPTAGQPATFVRLDGCVVRCNTCDTLYAVFGWTRGYKKGYLQGMRVGAGQLTAQGTLQIAAVDPEALDRTGQYWAEVFPTPAQARRLGGAAAGLELSGPEAVEVTGQAPRTDEERRGFVAGCFDAQGSCTGTDETTSRWRLEVATADDNLLDLLASGLDDWRFRHARRAAADNGSGAPLLTLHLGANNPGHEGEAAALAAAEQQRFFDTFRPASSHKYGPFLRRWQAQQLGVDEIVPQCHHHKLVVISGAEPLQQNLDGLIAALHQQGHTVQIETSGAFDFQGTERPDILVCSPKPNMAYRIAPTVYDAATIFKLVNGPPGSGFDWNGELAVKLRDAGKQVYLMPWGGPPTQDAIVQTADLAQELGVAFSPRLHYLLSIR
jgi:organic radical activating enzyme